VGYTKAIQIPRSHVDPNRPQRRTSRGCFSGRRSASTATWRKWRTAPNQIAGYRDINRVTVSIGKFSAVDFFDDNRYSHDPRS
jgi:hypothetical protein